MAVLRMFAAVRQVAGTGRAEMPGRTVAEVLQAAGERFGPEFAEQLTCCRIWCNGEPADEATPVGDGDEVALLPPVSGGCDAPSSGPCAGGGAVPLVSDDPRPTGPA